MNEDEMIEEMAKVLCDKDKRCEECISRLLLPCEYKSYCTRLYNANYRKVGDDEIVIKKQAYEKFVEEFAKQEEIAHSYEQGYTELLETNHQLQDKQEKTKKETAREIIDLIVDESGVDLLGGYYKLPFHIYNKIKRKYRITRH